jgi:hypothetical protein
MTETEAIAIAKTIGVWRDPFDGNALAKFADAVIKAHKAKDDEAIEALRKAMCSLPRYSFVLNSGGGVSRVKDRTGRWIEWDEAHKLFDPDVVDYLITKARAAKVIADAARHAAGNL